MKNSVSDGSRGFIAANVCKELWDEFYYAVDTLEILKKYDKFAESQGWNEMTDENCMDFLIYERIKHYLLVQTRAFFDEDSHSTTFLSVINMIESRSREELISAYNKIKDKYFAFLENCRLIRNKVIAHHDSVFLRNKSGSKSENTTEYNIDDVPTDVFICLYDELKPLLFEIKNKISSPFNIKIESHDFASRMDDWFRKRSSLTT